MTSLRARIIEIIGPHLHDRAPDGVERDLADQIAALIDAEMDELKEYHAISLGQAIDSAAGY